MSGAMQPLVDEVPCRWRKRSRCPVCRREEFATWHYRWDVEREASDPCDLVAVTYTCGCVTGDPSLALPPKGSRP